LLKSGTVPAGNTISGSVAIPSGLGAGWHSITLNSTDYRGADVSRAMYFKISPSGLLLASNFTGIPAGELAATGSTDTNGALWGIAISLASLGALLMVVALRRKSRSRRTK
jgi:LPXTG-motif cell wall-anchored protein